MMMPQRSRLRGSRDNTPLNLEREARLSWYSRLLLGRLGGRAGLGATVLADIDRHLLGDARRLAPAATQVIQLGTAHRAAAHHLDAGDARAVEREHALDALAVRDLAHGEAGVDPGVAPADAHALVHLDALARALEHLHLDAQGVARIEHRDRAFGGQLLDLF